MMYVFTIIGMCVSSVVTLILFGLLLVWLYNFIQEAYVGLKVILWLDREWNEMIRQGLAERESKLKRSHQTFKFFWRTFGSFRNTNFTSKLGNTYDWSLQ